MDLATSFILGYILLGVIGFVITIIIIAWIIKLGVKKGIADSVEVIEIAVRKGIVSAEKIKQEDCEEAPSSGNQKKLTPTQKNDICPNCGEEHPWVHGALKTKCIKCGFKLDPKK